MKKLPKSVIDMERVLACQGKSVQEICASTEYLEYRAKAIAATGMPDAELVTGCIISSYVSGASVNVATMAILEDTEFVATNN